MSKSYNDLDFNILLHHQRAYELIDDVGKANIKNWNILEFEKIVFSAQEYLIGLSDKYHLLKSKLFELDIEMPYCRYGEKGVHYGYELFIVPPDNWDSSGTPLWWAFVSREFTYDKLPMDEDYLFKKYDSIAKQFGLNMRYYGSSDIKRFATVGMRSGTVYEEFVRKGWYAIRTRNRMYMEMTIIEKDIYLDFAKKRLEWYIENRCKSGVSLNKDFDSLDFLYSVDASKATKHQKEVVFYLWGINTGKPHTIKETANNFGVTTNRITYLESRTLQHILQNKNNTLLLK